MRAWRRFSRVAWTATVGIALLMAPAGHSGVMAALYRTAVAAICIRILTRIR